MAVPAPPLEQSGDVLVNTVIDERTRFDFSFTIRRLTLEVEKKVLIGADGERRMLSGSTAAFGPPRYAVTWDFLANLTILVAQYAMPMNRISTLLSTEEKSFSSSSLSRLLRYVGERFAPIYLWLFDSLADSDLLSGDDTSCRVLEVTSAFALQDAPHAPRAPQEPGEQPEDTERYLPPWHGYRNREVALQRLQADATSATNATTELAVSLAAELGFEYERRRGTGTKRALNTTTLSGRAFRDDPRSLVVFYRSHLGGLGNLLETLLAKRGPRLRALSVQSDLSSVNLVADEQLRETFDIRQIGCSSHARRPFALYEHEDDVICPAMLEFFHGLAIHEQALNIHGRNFENVSAIRNNDSRELWAAIREAAEIAVLRWSAATKIGEGARYILRHFDKLTAYLDDPRLDPSNNFSERMLRLEKLIQSSSLFRKTLNGRFVLDVLRTVLPTAIAANAPLQAYLLAVLSAPPDEVANDPGNFTPYAWMSARAAAANAADASAAGDRDAGRPQRRARDLLHRGVERALGELPESGERAPRGRLAGRWWDQPLRAAHGCRHRAGKRECRRRGQRAALSLCSVALRTGCREPGRVLLRRRERRQYRRRSDFEVPDGLLHRRFRFRSGERVGHAEALRAH